MGFVCHQQEKARNITRREGKVDKVLCPQIIISREQTVNKFTQRREPFVASSSEQLQVFFSTFYWMMGKWAFLKYVLNERATMNPSTWLLAESMVHSMELCYAPTPLSFGSTARKVQNPSKSPHFGYCPGRHNKLFHLISFFIRPKSNHCLVF